MALVVLVVHYMFNGYGSLPICTHPSSNSVAGAVEQVVSAFGWKCGDAGFESHLRQYFNFLFLSTILL